MNSAHPSELFKTQCHANWEGEAVFLLVVSGGFKCHCFMFAALLGQSLVDFSCLLVSGTLGERSAKSVSFPHLYRSSHLYSFIVNQN